MDKKIKLKEKLITHKHPEVTHSFHLVDKSHLPLLVSFCLFFFVLIFVFYLHSSFFLLSRGFLLTFCFFFFSLLAGLSFIWFRTIILEGVRGYHTNKVKSGLRIGFVLFIISEVMFFFGFFWAFFHSSLSPAVEIGAIWPPVGISAINPFDLPLLNTLLLLLSGVTVTLAHHEMGRVSRNKDGDYWAQPSRRTRIYLFLTIMLAILFMFVQFYEFYFAPFSLADGIYGSCFFMITGLHGFHVFIGTIFLIVCAYRYQNMFMYGIWLINRWITHLPRLKNDFLVLNKGSFVGFECASWYWHFVDVVWLFVYLFVYWWGAA